MIKIPKLSFCITCKNRINQIRQTLRKNLNDNMLHKDFIEFILIDFDSNDGLSNWVLDNFNVELQNGFLKYYYTKELPYWHASIAKNTAHLCASGDILVNLDCDNYTGFFGGAYIVKKFIYHGFQSVTQQFSGVSGDGSFGRISLSKQMFYQIGGYDETLDPMGYEDTDLIYRLIQIGLKHILLSNPLYNKAIKNTKEEGIINTGSSKNYVEMLEYNFQKSHKNIDEGYIIANSGIFGIRENVIDFSGNLFYPRYDYENRNTTTPF